MGNGCGRRSRLSTSIHKVGCHGCDLGQSSEWWAWRDLNPQPDRYERPALTIELQAPPPDAMTIHGGLAVSAITPIFKRSDRGQRRPGQDQRLCGCNDRARSRITLSSIVSPSSSCSSSASKAASEGVAALARRGGDGSTSRSRWSRASSRLARAAFEISTSGTAGRPVRAMARSW